MYKKKYLIFIVAFFICLVGLVGCNQSEADRDEVAELEVYYLKTHNYYSTALGEFCNKYSSKYNIILTGFESYEDMLNKLSVEIAAGKGPDVVLLSSESDFDLYKAVKSHNIVELSSFFTDDESFNMEDYYEPIVDCGEYIGGQYIVPFTFSLDSLAIENEMLEKTGYSPENLNDFYEYIHMIEKVREFVSSDKLSIFSINPVNTQSNMVGRFLENSNTEIVNKDGKVSDTIGDIKVVMEFLSDIQKEYSEKVDVLVRQSEITFDKAVCISSNGNYPILRLMVQAVTANTLNTDYTVLPWKNVDGLYQPVICDYGYINQNSRQKEAAFFLLRYLMDYEIPFGLQYPISVNRSVVKSELLMLQESELVALQLADGSNIYTELLDDAVKQEIENTLDHMGEACVYNTGYYDIAISQIVKYFETHNSDTAIEDLSTAVDRYLRE